MFGVLKMATRWQCPLVSEISGLLLCSFPRRRLRCQQLDASIWVCEQNVCRRPVWKRTRLKIAACHPGVWPDNWVGSQSVRELRRIVKTIHNSISLFLSHFLGGWVGWGVRLALPEWSGKYMTDKGSNVNRAMIVGSDIAAKAAGFQIIGSDQEASAISLVALNLTWEKQGEWIAAFLLQFPAWYIRDQGVYCICGKSTNVESKIRWTKLKELEVRSALVVGWFEVSAAEAGCKTDELCHGSPPDYWLNLTLLPSCDTRKH